MDDWLTPNGDRTALVCGGRTVSYEELDAGASRVARRLDVRPGDRVATMLPPSVEFAELLHALPRRGAALVPINTRLSAAERRWQVEDSRARFVVEEPLDGPEREVSLFTSFDPDAIHSVIYTSGTTALPKRVELTFRNHHTSAMASARNLGVEPDDRWLCVLPLFHVGGLAILIRSAIYGTAAILHERFDVDAVAASLESGEATLVSLVATMLRRVQARGLRDAPTLRAALIGGGPVPRDLLEWSNEHGLPVLQTYGMTETASQIATLSAAEAVTKSGSAGRPLDGVELQIAGDGEILVRGPMVAPGALSDDGWLHTGDRGRIDFDGFLYVEGRIKDTIVTGGENVAATEVEEALLAHPAVEDAAVVGRRDPEWGEVVTAYVVTRDGNASDEDLTAHCKQRLAGFKVPRAYVRVDELPRNAAGKVLKDRLR